MHLPERERSGDLLDDLGTVPATGKVPGNLGMLMGEYRGELRPIDSRFIRRKNQSIVKRRISVEFIPCFEIDNSEQGLVASREKRFGRVPNGSRSQAAAIDFAYESG